MPGIGFPSKDAAGNYIANPFAEQLAFFQAKLNLPTSRWDDIMLSAHDRAFVVAGASNADLLNDLRAAVAKSIEGGHGLEAFRKEFDAIVLKHGWSGWTGEGTAAGQAWRTKVIYQTNMATSYAAGRWKQLNHPDLLSVRPYWRYVHADGVLHPRPLHVSWNGLTLRHDDPFWLTHFPPNGWGCHCRVTPVDAKEYAKAEAAGLTMPPEGWAELDPKTQAPVGIDRGFDYAPGANALRPMKDFIDAKLINLAAPVGAAMNQALAPVLKAERAAAYQAFLGDVLADPVKRGRLAVIGAIDPATLRWLEQTRQIMPSSAAIAVEDSLIVGAKAGKSLSATEWGRLPALLENPEQILHDTRSGTLLYIGTASDPLVGKLAAEVDYQGKGKINRLVSIMAQAATLAGDIIKGLFEVVK